MTNKLEHKFTIKRIGKTSDEDYIKALHIYNDTTPYEIKTPTNEITYWLNRQSESTPFEIIAFILYLNDKVIGLSMTTYLKKPQIVIDEYLAVEDRFRIQSIFLIYESLIQNYYKELNLPISYYLTEISYKNSGKEMDRESLISLKVLCVEEYGKIEALYYALPLGLDNHESNFVAHLYIKGIEPVKSISPKTYENIVESIYYDYWYTWYGGILPEAELVMYKASIDKYFKAIKDSLANEISSMQIVHSNCNYLSKNADISQNTIPVKKKTCVPFYMFTIPIVIMLPIFLIWGYDKVLSMLHISLSSASTMIGGIISAVITSFTTLFIAKEKI